MRIAIELRLICPDCEAVGITSGHGTTPEQCEWFAERPCAYPHEHHPVRRRRPSIKVKVSR